MTREAIEDAWDVFNSYMLLNGGVPRSTPYIETNGQWSNFYPQPITQQDAMVFATIFTMLWESTLKNTATEPDRFKGQFEAKREAFAEVQWLAKPNGFWVLDETGMKPALKRLEPTDHGVTHEICRTLRNGFNHFNYRFNNRTPREYFTRLGLPTPDGILKPDEAANFRIFICDHKAKKALMDADSDTRILDVPFAHLRFHLHLFLARFFQAEGVAVVKDVFDVYREPITIS